MNTFLQISAFIFYLLIIAVLVDIIYTRHYNWHNGIQVWRGKKFASRYSGPRKKKPAYEEGEQGT